MRLYVLALLAALAAARGAAATTLSEMILVKYDLTRFPYAVCNDGTAGARAPPRALGRGAPFAAAP